MQTYPRMIWTKSRDPIHISGFSFIEILIVVTIIAIITGLMIPSLNSYFQISINSAARDLASVAKEAFYHSLLTNSTTRLVFDLKDQQYWVESSESSTLLQTPDNLKTLTEEKKSRQASSSQPESTEDDFVLETSITRKKISLPAGVTFADIITEQSNDPIEEGLAKTHFFPHGYAEQTIVHLKDSSQHNCSVVLAPMLGTSEIYDAYIKPSEAYPSP